MNTPPNTDCDLRFFLGFGQPPLISATQWICQKYRTGSELDLNEVLLVLPTASSRQRLLQLLVYQAEQENLLLTPPEMVTVGDLPEYLYDQTQPLATGLCQQLAWSKALQQSPPWEIEELFGSTEKMTIEKWQSYATLISDLHQRLANDVWSFRSVVREVRNLDKSFREIKRWEVLEAIQGRYYELLNEAGLWDRQAARNFAIRRELCRADQAIVLIGIADLNQAVSAMLQQVRERVTVLVAAAPEMSSRFNEFGGLITEQWLGTDIRFPSERICYVDRVEDQAFAASYYLQQLDGEFAADEITIGIPDDDVRPQMERSLLAMGVKYRNVKGQPLGDSSPVQLAKSLVNYLEQQDYSSFAATVRHPDLFDWLSGKVKSPYWLAWLDQFQHEGLPDRLAIGKPHAFGNEGDIRASYQRAPQHLDRTVQRAATLNRVHASLSRLLKPLAAKPKSIAAWTEPWCRVLSNIYSDRQLEVSNPESARTLAGCRAIEIALREKQQVPDDFRINVSAARAMQLAIRAAAEGTVVPGPEPGAVELAGWLDLPLDDAPVMIITGMNDEIIPSSENGHLFLPDKLCKKLGIVDNDRRFARDAYALTVIHSVREHLQLICGRRDLLGEPLKPSRLLFADDNEIIAQRAEAFFAYDGRSDTHFWLADPRQAPASQPLRIPRPTLTEPEHSLTVTGFREYLKCPYRFYLSRIMRLEAVDDELQELDGGAFGTLLHEIMEDFGLDDVRDSTAEDEILDFLNQRLDDRAKLKYRGSRLPAVRLQIEQLRLRLQHFAPLQADRVRQGWRIVCTEQRVDHPLLVDGQPFQIRGTIDRVDVHEPTNQIAIWDYKTSDRGDSPNQVHLNQQGWKDLQLPLYRHLAAAITDLDGYDREQVQLGYILLPRDLSKVQFAPATWSSDQLAEADQLACAIVRDIRRNQFWPPARVAPMYSEDFAGICQDGVFEHDPLPWGAPI